MQIVKNMKSPRRIQHITSRARMYPELSGVCASRCSLGVRSGVTAARNGGLRRERRRHV